MMLLIIFVFQIHDVKSMDVSDWECWFPIMDFMMAILSVSLIGAGQNKFELETPCNLADVLAQR